jgi:hypothetical protein
MITLKLQKVRQVIFGLLVGCNAINAQTTIISPSGDGGFETGTGTFAANGWTVVNQSTSPSTAWVTGSGKTSGFYSLPSSSRCAFISGDGGTSWNFLSASLGGVHFYRDVIIPAGETNVILSFKYQQNGSVNARFQVFLCSTTLTPVAGQPTSGGSTVGTNGWGVPGPRGAPFLLLNTNTSASQAPGNVVYSAAIPQTLLRNCTAQDTVRLVFTWQSSTTVTNPPVAIDEISLVSSAPIASTPGTFTIDNTSPSSGTLTISRTLLIG